MLSAYVTNPNTPSNPIFLPALRRSHPLSQHPPMKDFWLIMKLRKRGGEWLDLSDFGGGRGEGAEEKVYEGGAGQ